MKLTSHFHLVPRLRMRGGILVPSIPPYVFMAWYFVKQRDVFIFTKTKMHIFLRYNSHLGCPHIHNSRIIYGRELKIFEGGVTRNS
jgi:hypothetical protein